MLHALLPPSVVQCALDPWYCICSSLGFRITKSKGMQTGNWRLLEYRRCHRVAYVELLLRAANAWATLYILQYLCQIWPTTLVDELPWLEETIFLCLDGTSKGLPMLSSCCRTVFRWTSVFLPHTILCLAGNVIFVTLNTMPYTSFHMLSWKCYF